MSYIALYNILYKIIYVIITLILYCNSLIQSVVPIGLYKEYRELYYILLYNRKYYYNVQLRTAIIVNTSSCDQIRIYNIKVRAI